MGLNLSVVLSAYSLDSGLVEKVATWKDKLEPMKGFCAETDLYKWLVQFTWECNIFTCSLKGVKLFLV